MKKLLSIIAILGLSIVLFSFTGNKSKKAEYNEVNATAVKMIAFIKYTQDHYTPDRGTWNYRCESGITNSGDNTLSDIKSALK